MIKPVILKIIASHQISSWIGYLSNLSEMGIMGFLCFPAAPDRDDLIHLGMVIHILLAAGG
jgi:hypothetical protein